jgi:undecaprenyl-diphosphatase
MVRPIENINKSYLWIYLAVSVSMILVLLHFDTRIWQAARDLLGPDLDFINRLLTKKGLYLFYGIFAALFFYAMAKKNKALAAFCLDYLKAQLFFSFALVRILKILLGRARPGHGAEFTFFSMASSYNAFPSGHAADAFVSGAFLFYLLKNTRWSAGRFLPLVYAFLIAASRVFNSSHYPSDVAAGTAIGIMGAWFFISRSNAKAHTPTSSKS